MTLFHADSVLCFIFILLKKLRWQSVECNTGHHCYDFEYEIKSELSQFKFYCLVINDVYFPLGLIAIIKFKD